MNPVYKNIMSLALVMLVLLAIFTFWSSETRELSEDLDYSEFLVAVREGQVAEVKIQGQDIEGTYQSGEAFKTFGPQEDSKLSELLLARDVRTTYLPRDESGVWHTLLITYIADRRQHCRSPDRRLRRPRHHRQSSEFDHPGAHVPP